MTSNGGGSWDEFKRYIDQLPQHISPYYDAEPNGAITLYEGEITLVESDNYETKSPGRLFAYWFPTPAIRFRLEAEAADISSWFLVVSPTAVLKVPGLNLEVEAQMTKMSPGIAEGFIKPHTSLGEGDQISHLLLHIVNFTEYHGEPVATGGTHASQASTNAQLIMENEDWHLTVHGLIGSRDRIAKLKKEYRYAITHTGKLRNKRKDSFTSDEAIEAIQKLNTLFSFFKGAEAVSFLTVGFNATDAKVWEYWGSLSSNESSMNSKQSWFPQTPDSELNKLFTGYMRLQADEAWSEVIDSAISWYVRSSYTASAEVAILFAQMGVELLSWAKFVEIEARMTADGFGRLPNADRMSLLLSDLSIPLSIPPELTELTKFGKSTNMLNGPQLITALRNNIVHPNLRMKIRNVAPMAQVEAVRLSLWYLELSLLNLFGYQGKYHNRLKASSTLQNELVPWGT